MRDPKKPVLDTAYPSVVIEDAEYAIDDKDPMDREKPDFVKEDDSNFEGV